MNAEGPLHSLVPELDRLRADPADYLKHREITVLAWPRAHGGRLYGCFFWMAMIVLIGYAVILLTARPAGPAAMVHWGVFAFLVILSFAIGWLLPKERLRWGACNLSGTGVRLVDGSDEVVCPWALFSAAGKPTFHLAPAAVSVALPVAAAAVPLVVASRDGVAIAQGMEVNTRQVHFRSGQEIILKNLGGQEDWQVLADLLLQLGSSLGKVVEGATPLPPAPLPLWDEVRQSEALQTPATGGRISQSVPETTNQDGWFTVCLTRLVCPPLCCDCGGPTAGTRVFQANPPLWRQAIAILVGIVVPASIQVARVPLPFCEACERALRRRSRKPLWTISALGFGGGFLWGIMMASAFADPKLYVIFPIVYSCLVGLVSMFVGWCVGRWWAERVAPVQLRNFVAGKGTVEVRFRRHEYAEKVLASRKDQN